MSNTPSRSKSRALLSVLAVAAVGFVVSLPWQRRQWDAAARLRRETQAQEQRVAELKAATAPTTPKSSFDTVEQLLAAGRTDEAARQLTDLESRLRADAPSQAALRLSDLFQRAGRIDRAYHWSQIALQKSPDGLEEALRAGYLDLLIGHAEPARARFLKAQKRYPNRPEPLIALALFLSKTEDSAQAEDLLRRAIALQPENWRARLLLAQTLEERNRLDAAREELEPLRSEATAKSAFLLETAALYQRQAQTQTDRTASLTRAEEALDDAAKLPDGPPPETLLFQRGLIHLLRGDKAKARDVWERVFEASPDYPGLRLALGRVLVQTGDRARGAALLKAHEKAESQEDEYNRLVILAGSVPQTADAHRTLARWCQAHGRDARARLEWEFVRKLAPNDPEAIRALKALEASD